MATKQQTQELLNDLGHWVNRGFISPKKLMSEVGKSRQVWYFWRSGHVPMNDDIYEALTQLNGLLHAASAPMLEDLRQGGIAIRYVNGEFGFF